jgi:hypothetical protein
MRRSPVLSGPLFAVLLLSASAVVGTPRQGSAQMPDAIVGGAPEVTPAVAHDVSRPLRSLAPATRPRGVREGPAVRRLPVGRTPAKGPDAAVQPPGLQTAQAPTAGTSFDGIGQGFTGPAGTFSVNSAPPDPDIAVGPNHLMQVVNTDIAVFGKSGTPILGPVPTNTVWSGFGGGCQANNDGDGTVIYDKVADRFVVSQFSVTGANGTSVPFLYCVAVSVTGDPTGAYNRYAFAYTGFPDYPKMSAWTDAYYTTFNVFNAAGTAFLGAKVCALDRLKMLTGVAATQQCFDTSTSFGGLLAADLDGASLPPAGAPNTVIGLGATADTLALWKFHVDFATSANTTFTGPTDLAVPAFTEACGTSGTCIPQSGGGSLDSLSDRLMYRLAYRNFADHQSLVVNHSVTAGTSVGVRWYEIRLDAAYNASLFQSGTYAPDASFRWMGSIAMDQAGGIGLGYSTSSSSLKPSIRYTGRLAGDAPGAMTQGEAIMITGAGAQGSSLTRWGDYSSLVIDPADDCTFWYVNEYIPANGTFNWKTRIGSFKLAGCGVAVVNDFSLGVAPSTISIVQNSTGTASVSTAVVSGVAETVALSVTGLPAGATASFSPASVSAGGGSTFTIDAGTANAGVYTLTLTGTAATATHSVSLGLTITASPDFSVAVSPVSRSINAGTATTYTVSSAAINGSAQSISLGISGLPAGVSGSFSPATVTAGGSSTLTLSAAAAAPPVTNASFTVTGTSGATSHTATATITINTPDFTVSLSPATSTIAAGTSTTYTVSTAAVNASTQTVALSVSGLPVGAGGSFSPATVTAGGTSTLTITTTAATAGTTTTFTVTGTSGSSTHTATASLAVTGAPDFTVALAPASANVSAGNSTTYTVSTGALNASTQSVGLSVSGLPNGATGSFAPGSVTAGGTATLNIATAKKTGAGSIVFTVTGTSGTTVHSATATLVVTKGKH